MSKNSDAIIIEYLIDKSKVIFLKTHLNILINEM